MWLIVQCEDVANVWLQWGSSAPYPCRYSIPSAALIDAGRKVQKILGELSNWALLKEDDELSVILHRLAKAGAELRWVLFDAPDKTGELAELQAWIDNQIATGDKHLTVAADPQLHVPWGTIFDGDIRDLDNCGTEIAGYQQFWNLKFTLSTVFSAYTPPRRDYINDVRLLSAVNRKVWADLLASNDPDRDRVNKLKGILDMPVGIAYNVETAEELATSAKQKNTLFHFFGHGRDGALDLGDDAIDVVKFKMIMERLIDRRADRTTSNCNLVFLNACDTMTGNVSSNFRDAATSRGVTGLVATEAPVPRSFAAKFALLFLQSLFVEGHSIGVTMGRLRHDQELWPLSLLYSCYAPDSYQITPRKQSSAEAPIPAVEDNRVQT